MQVGGWGWQVNFREVDLLPPLTDICIKTMNNFGWLNNLKSFFFKSYTVLPFLSAIIADGRACWYLGRLEPSYRGEGLWVLCPNMTLMNSGKFLRFGGPLPRLEIFPGQQETSETPSPQMGCFPLLIPRFRWTIAKRVWGSQSWGPVSKAISISMESLSLESQDMVYKTITRLDQTQHKLPWAEEMQAVC